MASTKSKNTQKREQKKQLRAQRDPFLKSVQFRKGSYHIGVTVAVVVILVLINLIFQQLPTSVRQIDVSAQQLYTLGEVTEEVAAGITQDVIITLVAESSNLDPRIEQLAENYAALSGHISVETVDPVVHPSVLTTYDTEENSVVVSCEATGKSRSIPFTDIILYDTWSYYYYGYLIETEFDGEGQITSALDYVVSDTTKQIYLMQGHGESELDSVVTDAVAKQHMDLSEVNLLLDGGIPEDCDALVMVAPTKDLADDELDLLTDYLSAGGNIYIMLEADVGDTPNIDTLLASCGIQNVTGYVGDLERYYQNNPFCVFPVLSSSQEITEEYGSDDLALLLYPTGFLLSDEAPDGVTVESFMTTSSNGILSSEEEDTMGEYVLGAAAIVSGEEMEGHLVAVSSSSLVEASIISAFSNAENLNLFMDSLTWFFDDVSTISIEAKSLEISYNTVLGGGMWSGLYIFVIPGAFLIVGLIVWLRRRKK